MVRDLRRVSYYPEIGYPKEDRQFLVPFLGGALIGGAAVGLTRPRPIYNVAPQSNPYPPYPPYYPYRPYTNMSYYYSSF